MTSLFPHPDYAESQPLSHTILYLHTVRAGTMAGSFIGILTASTTHLVSTLRKGPSAPVSLSTRILSHAPRGALFGALFGALATVGRMRGREDIEWQDRAWRLLENRGQMMTDWAVLGGAGVGGLAGVRKGAGIRGAAVGSAMGMVYMVGSAALAKAKESREEERVEV